jgi:hypothetical protein
MNRDYDGLGAHPAIVLATLDLRYQSGARLTAQSLFAQEDSYDLGRTTD